MKSHINTKFLHTSIIQIKIIQASDQSIFCFASQIALSSQEENITFIQLNINMITAKNTIAISKNVIRPVKGVLKSCEILAKNSFLVASVFASS